MADTRTPASRRAASSAGASRLPSARERRPALAALAVLLIVGGAFASGFLALQAGNRADFLRVKADVAQGEEITEADLESVSLPEDMDGGVVSADDMDDVVGLYAVAPLLTGTILTDNMVAENSGVEVGKEAVTFEVETIDPDLQEGAALKVYAVSDDGEEEDGYPATLISATYPNEESGIGSGDGSSSVIVKVLMDTTDAAAIQPAIDDERVTITETAPPEGSDDSGAESEGGE